MADSGNSFKKTKIKAKSNINKGLLLIFIGLIIIIIGYLIINNIPDFISTLSRTEWWPMKLYERLEYYFENIPLYLIGYTVMILGIICTIFGIKIKTTQNTLLTSKK